MARALILYNPAARHAPHPEFLCAVRKELLLAGFAAEVAGSKRSGDLTRLAREAGECSLDRVVVCGGDGSIREVAEGLRGLPVPLAIVPLGTSNVLAVEMGLPVKSPRRCAVVAARGRTRLVGLGSVTGSAFTFCASAGLDSMAVARVDLLEKAQTGALAYVHAALSALIEEEPPLLRVILPDGRRLDACQVFAARARHYGGPFILSRRACLSSPTLHLVVVSPPFYRHLLPALPRLWNGGMEDAAGVTDFDVESFTLEAERPVPIQADGDLLAHTPAEFRSEPGTLHLVFPK